MNFTVYGVFITNIDQHLKIDVLQYLEIPFQSPYSLPLPVVLWKLMSRDSYIMCEVLYTSLLLSHSLSVSSSSLFLVSRTLPLLLSVTYTQAFSCHGACKMISCSE